MKGKMIDMEGESLNNRPLQLFHIKIQERRLFLTISHHEIAVFIDILKTVVSRGIAGDAAISGEQVGGKTGTTDQTWDIWFDGFTPKYSAALWIGTDDNSELNTTSATAARLWSRIMSQVKRAKGGTYKEQPDNVMYQDGEFYIKGTQPPPAPKVVEKDKDDEKKDSKDEKKDSEKKEE